MAAIEALATIVSWRTWTLLPLPICYREIIVNFGVYLLSWWVKRIHIKAAITAPTMPGRDSMHLRYGVSHHGQGKVVGGTR